MSEKVLVGYSECSLEEALTEALSKALELSGDTAEFHVSIEELGKVDNRYRVKVKVSRVTLDDRRHEMEAEEDSELRHEEKLHEEGARLKKGRHASELALEKLQRLGLLHHEAALAEPQDDFTGVAEMRPYVPPKLDEPVDVPAPHKDVPTLEEIFKLNSRKPHAFLETLEFAA